ncbi:MAG: hypothetical protein WDO73_07700 [Ignavibacteriota bacterium]
MSALAARPAKSSFRWVICGMLFLATVIAYVDRGILGFIERDLERLIGFTTVEYGYMTGAFQLGLRVRLSDRRQTHRSAWDSQSFRHRPSCCGAQPQWAPAWQRR